MCRGQQDTLHSLALCAHCRATTGGLEKVFEGCGRLCRFSAVLAHLLTPLIPPPASTVMALGFSDGALQFVETGTGEMVRELSVGGHTDAITCLAFSADGLRLVSGAEAHGDLEILVPCDVLHASSRLCRLLNSDVQCFCVCPSVSLCLCTHAHALSLSHTQSLRWGASVPVHALGCCC